MCDSEIQGHTNGSTRTCTSSKNNIKATNVMAYDVYSVDILLPGIYEILHIMLFCRIISSGSFVRYFK